MSIERTAAVLTISDSAHQGSRTDTSGPIVAARLREAGWETFLEILPDEEELIASRLAAICAEDRAAAIFTTGGTGVALRDVTPEATRRVITREIPGIGEWMRLRGREATPMASLSRGLGGTCGTTLIVNLPGSPKGALQSLNAIIDLVPHIVDLLHGRTAHADDPKLSANE